jgi:hypothetical protein
VAEPRKKIDPKEIRPIIRKCADDVKAALGKAGEPIAEALLHTADAVEGYADEMRGYARGASTAASKAAASATEVKTSVAAIQAENAEFLTNLEAAQAELSRQADRTEAAAKAAEASAAGMQREAGSELAAIKSLEHGGAKGAEALASMSHAVGDIPTQIDEEVRKATTVKVYDVESGETKTLSGKDALAAIAKNLSLVAQTAGEAAGNAEAALEFAHGLETAVKNAFKAVDEKITFIMYNLMGREIPFSAAEVSEIEKPSFTLNEKPTNEGGKE